MKVRLHIDQHTDHDKDIKKLFEAAVAARPKNKKFYDDEEAAGRQAIEEAAKKMKNNKFVISHGGSYTAIALASGSSRLALITFAPGTDEVATKVEDKKPDYEPYGDEWEKEIGKVPIGSLEEQYEIKKESKELKADFVKRIANKLKAMSEAEKTANATKGNSEED